MFANNVPQFGHHVGQQIQVKKCSWHVCTCSKHFREHLLFDGMLSNLATMFANNSTHSDGRQQFNSFRLKLRDNYAKIVSHDCSWHEFSCKIDNKSKEKGLSNTSVKNSQGSILNE